MQAREAVPSFSAGIVILQVADTFADDIVAKGNDAQVQTLDAVSGPMFCTGVLLNDRYIWKSSELSPDVVPLYLWFNAATGNSVAGWFLSDDMWSSEKHKNKMQPMVAMWMPAVTDGDCSTLPLQFHFPYWAKLALEDSNVTIGPAYDVMAGRLADLALEIQVLREHEDSRAGGSGDDAAGNGDRDHGACGSNADDGSAQDVSAQDGWKPQQHGGWLPKVSMMMAAWYNKDYKYVGKLMDRFYYGSFTLKSMVDRKT